MNLYQKKPLVVLVCLTAIILSLGSLWLTNCRSAPKVDVKRYRIASEVLAKKIGEEHPAGSKIVVVAMDPAMNGFLYQTQEEGFSKGIKPYLDKIQIVERVVVKAGDVQMTMEDSLPSKVYFDIIEKHPDVDLIVSLIGIPLLTDTEVNELPQKIPLLYAVVFHGVGVKRAFEEGILGGAVVPKFGKAEIGAPSQSSDDLFSKYYEYVTDKDYDRLTF